MFVLSSVVLYISTKFVHGEDLSAIEGSVKFDCSRLPITYCCTTRGRSTCKAQCSAIHCDSDFYKRDNKLKEVLIRPETIYRNGVNDGDTADINGGIQMRTTRKSLPQKLSKRKYLPAPTSSNENESLVNMSESEDEEVTEDVGSSVPETGSTFDSGLESTDNTLKPNTLHITKGPNITLTSVQEKLQRKFWEIRSFKITRYVTPISIGSNSNLAELTNEECGVAPDFLPCLSLSQANSQFEECCRNKSLPTGCQQFCRYDVKESEIRSANGPGVCGISNIKAIVQCASNGRDNSECCRHKQIKVKSASRCEIFCRPGEEITRVGLQHIVCRKVMDEIIACHLSGLRN
uniref:DB domain-containing protein n=1 Tax=Elaeophora elaphi TaxID=1147741 RepID=A0A0R3S4E9_9BILA